MAWDFLFSVRNEYQGASNWGRLYMRTANSKWEYLSYTYELPWKPYESGPLTGKSRNSFSRIAIGVYEMVSRADGPRGWRLELLGTSHRQNIQIHRAHSSLFIEGCILPVHFNNFDDSKVKKGDTIIQTESIALMEKIKERYGSLKDGYTGNPTICISATLPAQVIPVRKAAHV